MVDKVVAGVPMHQYPWLSPVDIALARYNGGKTRNPAEPSVPLNRLGNIRNEKYVTRVLKTWEELYKAGENPCAQA
ncbi:MAG: hypothetical protein MZV70_36265 [Desulfobacterales bacterium]|nr:hypothetical protein [Desulfobacterales bacterium]